MLLQGLWGAEFLHIISLLFAVIYKINYRSVNIFYGFGPIDGTDFANELAWTDIDKMLRRQDGESDFKMEL